MKLAVFLAVLAGVAVAFQTSLNAAAQRVLGPIAVVAISGLVTSAVAFLILLFVARPELALTGRAVGFAAASGVLGTIIVGSIAFAAGEGGVARALSLVVGTQLVVGLLLDRLGVFGAGASELSLAKVLGVALILAGGVLVVRF